ncbi:hypothetical protein GGR42_000253 [Saonia flava]|uniref:Putative auto-transporter adhesin head GIN domain-containing protein n=1 Tax=Saonia flava TaxID=523696 RepID=A0A846QNY5_9FLAO|nr:head GIN domain-containing protein [Saonia flava]NJB69791.1 hypothetical protein [Saonia flava]
MKSITKILSITLVCFLVQSCDYESIRASSTVTVQEVSYLDYTALSVSDDFNAYVTFSDTEEKIEIEASRNLHDRIIVRKDGDKLYIKMENNLNIKGQETLNIYITTKQITDFEAKGDSRIVLENLLDAQSAKIELSGDSYFTGELFLNDLKLVAKGDSKADVYGDVGLLYVELTGDSTLKDYDLEVDDLLMDLRGDSDAYLTVKNTIDIDARGDSVLRYKGNAVITHVNLSGDSKIIDKN